MITPPTPVTTPKVHPLRPHFGIALMGALVFALVVFVLATRNRPPADYTSPGLRTARGDESWVEKHHVMPTALPTPLTLPVVPTAAAPVVAQRPYVQTPNKPSDRERSYKRALASDVTIKTGNPQVLETPQVLASADGANTAPITLKPAPPHTVTAWSVIYGTLETGINSDQPGDVLGRVSQDVKDSVSQTEVLIPTGATLHGHEEGRQQVAQNDTGLLVAWDMIVFPNGAELRLPEAPGVDSQGYPGFNDQVDNHYAKTWGPAFLISAITAGTMLATTPTYSSYQGYNPEQEALGAAGQSLGNRASGQLGADLNRNKPTITIRPGYHFRVLVTRDLTFTGP
jgi:type IV secretory pathway VirB10-like protein